jgi:hypothetical protein
MPAPIMATFLFFMGRIRTGARIGPSLEEGAGSPHD